LLKQGLSPLKVAAKIGCSVSSVYLWQERLQHDGEEGLKAKPVPGRPPKLSQGQKRKVTRLLLQGALRCGYATDLWTQRRVAKVIEREFGIRYHPHHVWRVLMGLGWSCQKPETRARERNEPAIAHWKRYRWPHIKKRRKAWGPSGVPR
jgi:transposase